MNSTIHQTSKIEAGSTVVNSSLSRHSFCGYDCIIVNCDIGGFCSIADRVIIGRAQHPVEYVSTSPVFLSHKDSVKTKFSKHEDLPKLRTTIESDVWIGDNVLIKAGVTIGVGAVIGMGSVVTKDVAPYTIVGGCPAKLIRKRFDDKTIKKLLISEWWNFSDDELIHFAVDFNNVHTFLDRMEIEK